ncbi:MAG: L-malate glycosyltransferase [Anaerophaga sp.]|nr:L-malate glycosyltransferase [Anaerophaga sp.]
MKILFLNYIPSPYRIDFFNELAKHCELKVVYYNAEIAERPTWRYKTEDHHYEHFNLFRNENKVQIKGFLKLRKLLKTHKDHTIVVGGYARPVEIAAIAWLRAHHRPFVLNTDGGFYQGDGIKLKLKKWLVQSAAFYLANGTIAAKTLQQYGAKPENIYNYHFSSIFEREITVAANDTRKELRKKLQLPQNAKIVITIGRYIPLKGFELVIKALHLLKEPNTYLYMLGEGPQRKNYEQLITGLDLKNRVILTGEKQKNEVLDFCRAADCMVLPTLSSDVWGLVVNEAMSCGLPVIASDRVGAAYDMIKNGITGFIVPADNVKAIAEAIKKIDAPIMRNKTIETAKKYTIEQMVEDHKVLFKKICQQQ